jgi:F-type H+-transporting ATPase subunit gamma
MQIMAAHNLQEAQTSLPGLRLYVETIEESISQGALLLGEHQIQAVTSEKGTSQVLLVICSEHGFVGELNDRLLERAESILSGYELVVIGRRGESVAREQGLPCTRSLSAPANVNGVIAVTRRVIGFLQNAGAARLVFASYRKGANYEIVTKDVLPLKPVVLARRDSQNPPLCQLEPGDLMRRLSLEYLFAEIAGVLMETLASENGARLKLMQSGDQNIGEKLDVLNQRVRNVRQENITTELYDVIAGSEAILRSRVLR